MVAVVLLLAAMRGSARGSSRWTVLWGGTTAYLLYQGVMFCFATPFNRLFLVYVAHLSPALWRAIVLARSVDADAFARRVGPATFGDDPIAVLDGSGLLTSPVWVQDLAFWVPATVLAGVAMWRGRTVGMVATLTLLTFAVVTALPLAWFSRRLDRG